MSYFDVYICTTFSTCPVLGDSSYAMQLVNRCQLLKKFTYWISLELLPVSEAAAVSDGSSSRAAATKIKMKAAKSTKVKVIKVADKEEGAIEEGEEEEEEEEVEEEKEEKEPKLLLTTEARTLQRKAREDILAAWYIYDTGNSPYTECNKLLKDLQRGRNKIENLQISYFLQPVNEQSVTDYAVYVRNPIDLSTIKFRLDGSLPGTQFIANAIGLQFFFVNACFSWKLIIFKLLLKHTTDQIKR
jgi:hypothetical protein